MNVRRFISALLVVGALVLVPIAEAGSRTRTRAAQPAHSDEYGYYDDGYGYDQGAQYGYGYDQGAQYGYGYDQGARYGYGNQYGYGDPYGRGYGYGDPYRSRRGSDVGAILGAVAGSMLNRGGGGGLFGGSGLGGSGLGGNLGGALLNGLLRGRGGLGF